MCFQAQKTATSTAGTSYRQTYHTSKLPVKICLQIGFTSGLTSVTEHFIRDADRIHGVIGVTPKR